jgi:hypothetical protein
MAASRVERMRRAMQADLDKLPDESPPKPKPKKEELVQVRCGSASTDVKRDHVITDTDSEDSEEDCEMEMIQIEPEETASNDVVGDDTDSSDEEAENEVPARSGPGAISDNLIRGELSAIGEFFVPVVAFSKFPYKYITKNRKEDVADAFFNAGKFWDCTWDL